MTRAIGRATVALVAFVVAAGSVRAQQGAVERRRMVVIDLTGRPVPNARVRVAGRRTFVTDERGVVVLDSLTTGAIVLDVTAIGYVPERRTLPVRAGTSDGVHADTIVLPSLSSVLDTVRIATAGAVGFDVRRRGKIGQFITAGDVERANPRNTIALLRGYDGMKFTIDRNGIPSIEMHGGPRGGTCRPFVLIDGFPMPPTMPSPGHGPLNDAMHLDEIGGVELYTNPATIPPAFAIWAIDPRGGALRTCGAIVFWTRAKLGLPPAPAALQKP